MSTVIDNSCLPSPKALFEQRRRHRDEDMMSWRHLHKGRPVEGAIPLKSWVKSRPVAIARSVAPSGEGTTGGRRKLMRQSTIPLMYKALLPSKPTDRQKAYSETGGVEKYVKSKTGAWKQVLKLLDTPLLDKGTVLCDEEAMGNPVSAPQRMRTLDASNMEQAGEEAPAREEEEEEEAQDVAGGAVMYTGPAPSPDRERGVLAAYAAAFGHEIPVLTVATPQAKQSPAVRRRRRQPRDNSIGMSRRAFYSINDWNPEFLAWMNTFCAALTSAMVTFERGYKLQGMNATYAAKGQCSRCRRKTRGLSDLDSINKRLDSYTFYACNCPSKQISHCVRCTVFEYIIEARRIHGDFRITNADGDVIGVREIPCIEKCTNDKTGKHCTWSLASLMEVGPPSELEKAAIKSSWKKTKKAQVDSGAIPVVRRKKRPGSKPTKRRPKIDTPVARD